MEPENELGSFASESAQPEPIATEDRRVNTERREIGGKSVWWILSLIIASFFAGNMTGGIFMWTWVTKSQKQIIASMIPPIATTVSAEELEQPKIENKTLEKTGPCMEAELPSVLSENQPAKCWTTKGNTLWNISNRYCLEPWLYEGIMADNGIREAEKLPIGIELTIKCREITSEDEKFLYGEPETSEPVITTPPTTFSVQNTEEEIVEEVEEVKTPNVIEEVATSSTVSEEPEIKDPVQRNEKRVLKEGLYVIDLSGFEVTVGVHPTSILIRKDEDELWEQTKTVTYITDEGNNNNRVIVPIRKDVEFGPESFVAFDQGDGDVVQLTYDDLAENRVRSTKGLNIVKLKNSEYEKLLIGFPKKPSKWSKVRKTMINVGTTGAIAYFTSGGSLVATAFPAVSTFVGHRLNQAQKKAFRLLQGEQK